VTSGAPVALSFGGRRLEGIVVGNGLVTAVIPDDLFETPGQREIVLTDRGSGRRLIVGAFTVTP
jgi:hypothetical protein